MRPPHILLLALAFATTSPPALASSANAWAAHKLEVVSQCSQASGLKEPRLIGDLIEYDDRVGYIVALIAGLYPQPHLRQQPGRSLVSLRQTPPHGPRGPSGRLAVGTVDPMGPASCAICRLHGDAASAAFEIARSDLWLLRHHPDPAPLAGWLLLDARRHLAGPLAFTDREATSWGRAVRHASQLVQQLTGCDRVYAIAFGEGAPHLHLHLIPRHGADPATAAWSVADHYRAVAAREHPAVAPDQLRELVARARQLVVQL